MTIQAKAYGAHDDEESQIAPTDQIFFDMLWESRGVLYTVSTVTFTHNPEYPTPAINVTAPNPGIRFTVQDHDGNVLYTNQKVKE